MSERILDVTGQAVERSQTVHHIVGLGILLEQFFEVFAGRDVIADVHQRDSEIEMLLGSLELGGGGAVQMLVAGVEMDRGAVDQFLHRPGDNLLEMGLRLVVLVLLHGAQAVFVALQCLRVARIFGHGLFRGRFLSHVQNSSCALGNGELLRIVLFI